MARFTNTQEPERQWHAPGDLTEWETDADVSSTEDSGSEPDDEQDGDPNTETSLLDRVAKWGKKLSEAIGPFTEVLTAVVQLYTVRRLVA